MTNRNQDHIIRELADRLKRLEDLADQQNATSLGHSSMEGGAITVFAPNTGGEVQAQLIGRQYDGSYGAYPTAGFSPPVPTAPEAVPGPLEVVLTWDGRWADSPYTVAPMDWSSVEVHTNSTGGPAGVTEATFRGILTSARGGQFRVSCEPGEIVYAWFVARTLAGKFSQPSNITGPTIALGVAESQLDIDFTEFGGSTVFYGTENPANPHNGDLWLKQVAAGPPVKYETRRYIDTTWELLQDQSATEALTQAAAAISAANSAGAAALAASSAATQSQNAADAAQNTANGKTTVFRQDDPPPTTGRTVGDEWIESDQGNRRYTWNGAWTLTTLAAGALNVTARQLGAIYTYRQATAPVAPLTMVDGDFWIRTPDNRIFVRAAGAWQESGDTAINTALTNAATAQAVADGKMRIFTQDTPPTGLVAGDVGDLWIDTDNGNKMSTWTGTAWADRLIGNGAIQPASLIAKDVIATGSISAALLEAVMILATTIVLGDATATHTELTPTGIRIYTEDPVDGVPNESIRLGTGGNDFLGVTDATGAYVGGIDLMGGVNGRALNIQGDPVFQGVSLSERLAATSGGNLVGFFRQFLAADLGPIQNEIGVMEVNGFLQAGRSYLINMHFSWFQNIPGNEAQFRLRSTRTATTGGDDAPAPTISSTSEEVWWRTQYGRVRSYTEDLQLLYNCTRTGRHRFLLTAQVNPNAPPNAQTEYNNEVTITPNGTGPVYQAVTFPWVYDGPPAVFTSINSGVPGAVRGHSARNVTASGCDITLDRQDTSPTKVYWRVIGNAAGAGRITIDNTLLTSMTVVDAGSTALTSGQQTAGGGTIGAGGTQPSSPSGTKQSYDKTLSPVGRQTWSGSAGTIKSGLGTMEVMQGGSASTVANLYRGAYWFDLPVITGTVDKVEVYLNAAYWYNSYKYGAAVINITDDRNVFAFSKLGGADLEVADFPQPGGKWVTLPSAWWQLFKGSTLTSNNGRAMGITLGPGVVNNDYTYGRFDKCQLRIRYTQ